MNNNMKHNALLLFLILLSTNMFAQFDGLRINLAKKSMFIAKNQRISIYCSFDDNSNSHYYVGNKANSKYDSANSYWDFDTIREISKEDFNRISEMALGLSSVTLLGALDPSEVRIVYDPTTIDLELWINGQSVSYSLFLPLSQDDFHNRQFLDLCEQIVLLAGEDPNKFLEIKKKWYQR